MRFRQGRKLGRTIYRQFGPEAADGDLLVGLMDTAALARLVVEALNDKHAREETDGAGR